MTAKEIKFITKSEMENFIINKRNIIYLVVDCQHLRIVYKDRKDRQKWNITEQSTIQAL